MDEARAGELLQRERQRIESSLASLENSNERESTPDPADDATNLHSREVDEGLVEGLRADLAAINRAEERIGKGTYGLSIESGKPIPDERLEALPWAERTVEEDEHHQTHR